MVDLRGVRKRVTLTLDYTKSEDNPEEDETWIQREFIQVWILMALSEADGKKDLFILNYVKNGGLWISLR